MCQQWKIFQRIEVPRPCRSEFEEDDRFYGRHLTHYKEEIIALHTELLVQRPEQLTVSKPLPSTPRQEINDEMSYFAAQTVNYERDKMSVAYVRANRKE